MVSSSIITLLLISYIGYSIYEKKRYDKELATLEHRIHVNGIRGKSSVTRLVAAALREGNIKTAAKTTGTSARIIVDHETDINVIRKEADISEQKRLVSLYLGDKSKPYSGQKYSAAVFECMAINPVYQKYLEEKIMQSTIGIITNVREDHTEQLGNTLEEIAKSLCSTIPTNGHLITAESNPEVLNIIRSECAIKNTRLHIVSGESIAEGSMKKFTHYEHKTNVAVALKAAQLLGVDRKTAMLGMHKAQPDPGAFRLASLEVPKKKFYWANMFAINDRESFVLMVNELQKKVGDKTKKAVILNNRHDRPERVIQFLDICLEEIKADYIITFGDYEKQIVKEFQKRGSKRVKLINMGNSTTYKNADGRELLDQLISKIRARSCVLYGTVNIHTPQAKALLKVLEPII